MKKSKKHSKKRKTDKIKNSSNSITTGELRITVLSDIEGNPRAFYKKLKRFFRQEMIYTKTFRLWEKQKRGWRIKHLRKLKRYPGEIAAIANIIKALDKNYPVEKEKEFTYGNKTVVETANIIYEAYKNKIWDYMKKALKERDAQSLFSYTKEEALEEQKARGFIHKDDVELDTKLPYIRSIVDTDYVWPQQWPLAETYDKFGIIGVSGYTGIRSPRNYRN